MKIIELKEIIENTETTEQSKEKGETEFEKSEKLIYKKWTKPRRLKQ